MIWYDMIQKCSAIYPTCFAVRMEWRKIAWPGYASICW